MLDSGSDSTESFDPELTTEGLAEVWSLGMRLSRILVDRVVGFDCEGMVQQCFRLQERAQYSQDARIANQAYLSGKIPDWQ